MMQTTASNERLSKDNTLFEIESQLLLLEDIKMLIFKLIKFRT